MKKRKLKNYLKLGILLFGISLLLWNCEEENITENEKVKIQIKPTIKTLSSENVGEVFNKLKNELQLHPYLQLKQEENTLARTTTDTLGITIYTDIIKEITLGNYTSYTMCILTPNSEDSIFYNLTIEDKNGQSDMFITKYIPTENWLNDTKKSFEGSVTRMRGEAALTTVGDETDEENPNDLGGGGTNSSEGSPYYPTDCDGWVITTIEEVPYQCSCEEHWPWESCNCGITTSGTQPGYHQIPFYTCEPFDAADTGNPSDTNNNPNTGGGGTSENGIGNVNPDDSSITVLLPPGEECENPPPGDLNGDCQLDAYESCLLQGNSQEVCDCVAEGNDLSICQENIKCERLNRLVQNDSIGSNILPIVNQLRTKLDDGNNEWSISYKNKWVDGNRKNLPDEDGIQEGTSNTRSEFSYGNTWVGQIHTHPNGTYNIFSWLDLRALKLLHTDSHDDFNDEIFVMVVAPNNITYALRVDNITTLIDKIAADMQNADGNADKEKRDNIMKEMAEDYRKSNNLEQTFLELYGDYGISLYEATDTNLSNWKQLELDKSDNETVNEIPCN